MEGGGKRVEVEIIVALQVFVKIQSLKTFFEKMEQKHTCYRNKVVNNHENARNYFSSKHKTRSRLI